MRTPKILGKEGKKHSKKQGIPCKRKKQGVPKKQGQEDQRNGRFVLIFSSGVARLGVKTA